MGVNWTNRDWLDQQPVIDPITTRRTHDTPNPYKGWTVDRLPEDVRTAISDMLSDGNAWVLLHGVTGAGKTRAAHVAATVAAEQGKSTLVATAGQLLASKASLNQELWRRAYAVDFLVLDDVLRGWDGDLPTRDVTRLTDLLSARVGKPTLMTDNMNPTAITPQAVMAIDPNRLPLIRRIREAHMVAVSPMR